jgi:starch-binding outer membrane protein, SusD/RagB family
MKILRYTYIIFALSTVLFSCKKDYLVQNPPNAVPVGSAIKTPNDMADAVNGMYAAMSSNISFGRDIPVLGDLRLITFISAHKIREDTFLKIILRM